MTDQWLLFIGLTTNAFKCFKELSHKLSALEKRYDQQFQVVFEAIREIMTPSESKRRKIGFHSDSE